MPIKYLLGQEENKQFILLFLKMMKDIIEQETHLLNVILLTKKINYSMQYFKKNTKPIYKF